MTTVRWIKYSLIMLVVVPMLCGIPGQALADKWIPFGRPHQAGMKTKAVTLKRPLATPREVVIDLDVPGLTSAEVAHDGVVYQSLFVQGGGHLGDAGKPDLPTIGKYIAIPESATARVSIIDTTYKELSGYTVFPAQPRRPDSIDAPIPFAKDEAAYKDNRFFPRSIVTLEPPTIIRGCRAAILKIVPVQFNPADKTLRVYSKIQLKITFTGGIGRFINPRKRSQAFDRVLHRLFVNSPADSLSDAGTIIHRVEATGVPEAATSEGSALLIITPPDFLDAANTLKDWKIKKGIQTEVRSTTDTGDTATDIRNYIKNAYDTWSAPPAYVLLIGDVEFIPCNYETPHPYTGDLIGTDLYYTTVDGTDYFPDISLGRLSVDTEAEAIKRVNDIIAYEQTPIALDSFYQTVAACAYFQDTESFFQRPDGMTSRRFAQTTEDLASFFSNPEYLGAYTVDRIYYTESDIDPEFWATDAWNFGGGPAGNPGDAIPPYLLKPTFAWDGGATDISAAVNAGCFLLTHRDHGMPDGWGDPSYVVANVLGLSNADRLPVVWSINCETGWFDSETDGSRDNDLCFSEAWERNPNGGAIGIIAATRVSYSGDNDRLFWGWADAVWPDFIPGYTPSGTPFDDPVYEMGPVLNYGKYYYASIYGDSDIRQCEFEIFHWFGDPTMQIWTASPQTFSVSHAQTLFDGTFIDVSVDQPGAVICISKDGAILGKTISTGATDTIAWSAPLATGDEVSVVVTKHNFRPYIGSATVNPLRVTIPEKMVEGDGVLTGQGRVERKEAGPGPLFLTLSSSDTSEVLVPSDVTIADGHTSAVFDLTVVDDTLLDGTQPVELEAAFNTGDRLTTTGQVDDNETAALTVDVPSEASEGARLLSGQGLISVSDTVDSDVSVSLQSDDTSEVVVPQTVVVSAGQSEASFDVTIVDDSAIDGRQTATITARVNGWETGSDTIDVIDDEPMTLSLYVPGRALETDGVLANNGIVSISGTLTDDLTVYLVSNDETEATIPDSVIIPSGQTAVTFDITVVNDAMVDGEQTVTITATSPGWPEAADTITVVDFPPLPPYSETFSDNRLSDEWAPYSSSDNDQVYIQNGRLHMTVPASADATLNEAVLTINLEAFNNAVLTFFQAENDDRPQALPETFGGHYNGDGVSISADGQTWYTIVNAGALSSGSIGQTVRIGLDAEVDQIRSQFDASFGYTETFKIKFQQFAASTPETVSREWDTISVTGTRLRLTIPEEASEDAGILAGQGTVVLYSPAASDFSVALFSNDTTEVIVPSSITIPAGQTTGYFDITVSDDTDRDGPQTVTITASAAGYTDSLEQITIIDNEQMADDADNSQTDDRQSSDNTTAKATVGAGGGGGGGSCFLETTMMP